MPGGHASHKSTSVKPNTNTNGVINVEDDAAVDMPDIVTQTSTPNRADEAPENAAATERPEDQNQHD